jgi:hypothetical protein
LCSVINYVYGVELKILESQLNENSISGILQNQYDYPVGSIIVRAEFYDKNDGHLVGVRDLGSPSKDPLEPHEKSSYKIPEFDKEFPRTEFVVKAEGLGYTDKERSGGGMFSGLIQDANKLTEALNNVTHAAEELKNKTRDLNLTQTP